MHIDWASLGIVAVVALAASVVVVALVSFALVGLSARERARTAQVGGPHDGATPPLSGSAGTAIAAVCLTVVVLIVLYGLAIVTKLL